MESQTNSVVMATSMRSSEHVRQVFENSSRYLKSRNVDIRFRIDTVSAYASNVKKQRVLDIGCGDGSISLQLLLPTSQFTLMDISTSMAAMARANIPAQYSSNVEIRNENFATAMLDPKIYDLVIAVGVMAHIDSPDAFLKKINGLLIPGGNLILEFTDAFHFIGRLGRFWSWFKEFLRPARYKTNKLSHSEILELLARNQFSVVSSFRYSRVPLPGFNILVNHAREYRLIRALFGDSSRNRNATLGNEFIFLLRSK